MIYLEINKNIDNIWSMLYISGYLAKVRHIEDNIFELRIPNEKVKELFASKANNGFEREIFEESKDTLKEICVAFNVSLFIILKLLVKIKILMKLLQLGVYFGKKLYYNLKGFRTLDYTGKRMNKNSI